MRALSAVFLVACGTAGPAASTGGPDAAGGPSMDDGETADTGAAQDAGPTAEAGRMGADRWGIVEVHPTIAGGREWYLPDDADQTDPTRERQPESEAPPITKNAGTPPSFTTGGGDPCGQVRLNVTSPAGKAWWKNVEMTWYVRYDSQQGDGSSGSCGQSNHWELHARGERHSSGTFDPATINDGVAAPAGTRAWPGYPFTGFTSLSEHCLGTAYHGNYYTTGRYLFEKEITHSGGYADVQQGDPGPRWADGTNRNKWIGMKWIVRTGAAGRVDMELWLDEGATGDFVSTIHYSDTGPSWTATSLDDPCGSAPFGYTTSQLIDWAGPWVTFRSDDMVMDFKEASAREIDGL